MLKQDAESGIVTENLPGQESNVLSRERLIELLNEDLAREYQAIIAYVIYSQMIKGAAYQAIAKELEIHAGEELQHALLIAKQIDFLGGTPVAQPKEVKISNDATVMLQADLHNETVTIRNYRDRVRQCEKLGEFAMAENIRTILVQEQEHQIDLATALGVNPYQVAEKEEHDSLNGAANPAKNRATKK
jgi:bacterioferritin